MIEERQLRNANIVLYLICLFWIVILVWANFATLEEVTKAQGRVLSLIHI